MTERVLLSQPCSLMIMKEKLNEYYEIGLNFPVVGAHMILDFLITCSCADPSFALDNPLRQTLGLKTSDETECLLRHLAFQHAFL